MSLFWLSFCDPNRPKGQQFLGACIVRGGNSGDDRDDLADAVRAAWVRGCNPGGEVQFVRVMPSFEPHIAPHWMGRLLTREECAKLDKELLPHRVS